MNPIRPTHPQHFLVIGAGGVASYLLPVLVKTFFSVEGSKITVVDKDILEPRNLDRQLFRADQVDCFKAQALVDLVRHSLLPQRSDFESVRAINDWFTADLLLPDDVSVVICVADNHPARRAALEFADAREIPCIIGGNEYFDHEAHFYSPLMKGTMADPRERYPEIALSNEGSPMRCTGEILKGAPQLAIANHGCASHILKLLWEHLVWFQSSMSSMKTAAERRNFFQQRTIEISTSIYGTTYTTHAAITQEPVRA